MRILHILEPSEGGVAKHVCDLAGQLLARGHRLQAVVASRGELATRLRALGVGVVTLDLRPEITAVASDARALRSLTGILHRGNWDVVHTHGNKAGALARPLAWALGLPVVHSPHSFAYISQRHRPRAGMEGRRLLTLGIERVLAPCADVIVCVSESERADALREGIADPDRMVVVRNGIAPLPPAEPDAALAALDGDGPLVGFLARLAGEKAPLAFLDALADVHRRGVRVRGALVGDGPLASTLRERIRELGLDRDVALMPFPPEVAPVLAAFDVYVLPSLWESLPIGLLEAMAAGLPVIASDVGGVREAVLHERTGLLVPPGDPVALAAALERLIADGALRRRLGEAGRDHRAAEFSLDAMVRGIEAAYESARERARSRRRGRGWPRRARGRTP